MRLRIVDPQSAVIAIDKLFAGPDGINKNGPRVQAEASSRTLVVNATQAEVAQIRNMLEQMGETNVINDRVAESGSNVPSIPLTGRSAQNVLQQIELVWPTISKNKIRRITPSASRSNGADGALRDEQSLYEDGIIERRLSASPDIPNVQDLAPVATPPVDSQLPPRRYTQPDNQAPSADVNACSDFDAHQAAHRRKPRGRHFWRFRFAVGRSARPGGR